MPPLKDSSQTTLNLKYREAVSYSLKSASVTDDVESRVWLSKEDEQQLAANKHKCNSHFIISSSNPLLPSSTTNHQR